LKEKSMAVDTVGPKDETSEFQGPVSTYQVVEANPLASDSRFVAADLRAEEEGVASAPAPKQEKRLEETLLQEARRSVAKRLAPRRAEAVEEQPGRSSTKMVMALGVGLGILSALAVVAFVLMPGKSSDSSYDMGAVTSTSTGLKGLLVTNWGDRLDYKLTIEPSDGSQQDAFATAVNDPPEPIALNLQLKDVSGKVLCETPILMKFDPLKKIPNVPTREPSPTNAKSKNAKVNEAVQTQAEVDQALNNARLVGQELSREHGKDMFSPVTGDDGQIASIAAQGTLPCTKKQYQSAASWAFVTNFPSILQPAGPQDSDTSDNLEAFGVAPGRDGKSLAARNALRRAPLPNSHFSVEEDDSLVNFQAATGIAETRAGKSFLVEKRDLVASSLKGVELPIPIHYRCDQLGACSLAGLNSGIQRAWLER
jgi:hypothetical protein